MTIAPRRRPRHRPAEYLVTALEVVIVLASLVFVVTGAMPALLSWEALAAAYLIGGFILVRYRSREGRGRPGRSGVLDTLSWVLPFAASLVGVYCAVLLLINRAAAGTTKQEDILFAVTTSLGIIASWHLLHTGFAHVYERAQLRSTTPGLVFPAESTPTLVDFLYFSFTIGTSFATSDTTVNTSEIRWIVLTHSVLSFFYNALVVATAFQIVQQLAQ